MNRRKNLSVEDAVKASTLLEEGYSMRYVANLLGRNHSTRSRMVERFNQTESYNHRPGQGRKQSTDARDERFLRQFALRSKTGTGTMLEKQVGNCSQCHDIVSNWNTESQDYVSLEIIKTGRLMIGKSSDGRERVWRRPEKTFASCNITLKILFGGGTVMFWGGICFNGRTELVLIRTRTMNADYHLENVVVEHVMPFAPFVGPNFVFVQDNARSHVARQVIDYLNAVDLQLMELAPDLSSIEHLWDALKKKVRSHTIPVNHNQLVVAVIAEWENIPQDVIENLISSMPRRMNAVIKSIGGHTR
ncbi:hypothetical protein ILUMI_19314 [Ignelater luminosus]|uniref:Transposase IS30-like HTH domain-containing protein n=1 Tax=Ignelater luminosus TaxID=2038154 RepID=A0A8K0G5L0_IGNLU|nr:hypothetical protein ILUMI_19314 [Ignelater luminosus]